MRVSGRVVAIISEVSAPTMHHPMPTIAHYVLHIVLSVITLCIDIPTGVHPPMPCAIPYHVVGHPMCVLRTWLPMPTVYHPHTYPVVRT